jgi:hypothetical protein
MPTNNERIANTALSGGEVKQLIRADCDTLLAAEGMLSDYVAYGRMGYRLTLALYIDNPHHPRSESHIVSRPHATAEIAINPPLAAVETPPLTSPSEESAIGATSLSRNISSPNAERLRANLPIPVAVLQQDGTTIINMVRYPANANVDPGDIVIDDVTEAALAEWKR